MRGCWLERGGRALGTLAALTPLACAGAQPAPLASSTPAASAGTASGYALPSAAAERAFPAQPLAEHVTESRLVRLNHRQYRNTVQDLLGGRAGFDLALPPDAHGGFIFDTDSGLLVDGRLGPQYRIAAEVLAERAVSDAATYARIVPCRPAAPGCRDAFLNTFGGRVFRRPLETHSLQSLQELFDAGAARFASGDGFRDGVRMSVEALLQAPDFLYRTVAAARGSDGKIRLDDFDVASRLSYFLYDSMPDAELTAAAAGGLLHTPEQIEAAARRMLKEARVLPPLVAFHEQLWGFERFAGISPDTLEYPELPPGFAWRVRRAARLFIRDVLVNGGGLEELLTAPYVYADDGLAPLYGVPARAPEAREAGVDPSGRFARREPAGAERKGMLMQLGYLASNAYSASTDPIHRGLFIVRNLLCREVPDPPPGATTTPLPDAHPPIVTTRDEVSVLTGQSFCPTCHTQINAPGYAFEAFDAIGQERQLDNGHPVDTSASMQLDGELVFFSGAAELVEHLARSREAHRCYSRRWLEFALGRPLAASDATTLDALAAESRPLAELLVAIVRSPQFSSLPASAGAPP